MGKSITIFQGSSIVEMNLIGARQTAKHIGVPEEEYIRRRQNGEKWCSGCKSWKSVLLFNKQSYRWDRLSGTCRECNRVKEKSKFPTIAPLDVDTHLLAYSAGVIDSDGHITIYRKSGPKRINGSTPIYYMLKVACNQVDRTVPDFLQSIFGGKVYPYKVKTRDHLPYFLWSVHSQEASRCASLILPYLQLKRKQAELSVEFSKLIEAQYYRRSTIELISDEMEAERDRLYWAIRQLNHSRNPKYNQTIGRFARSREGVEQNGGVTHASGGHLLDGQEYYTFPRLS